MLVSGSTVSSTCVMCDSNCASCSISPNICDSCASGYTLKGWNCIRNYRVEFNLELDIGFMAFTTEKYLNLSQ